jgi:hypothetical protein
MRARFSLFLCVLLALVAVPATAQYPVYDNGPINGFVDAWTINFGLVVSDTFSYRQCDRFQPCSLNGLSFGAFLSPGDVLQSVEVSITSSEFGGTTYFDGVVNFTQSDCFDSPFGLIVCKETGNLPDVVLNTGNYWLNLQNAITESENPAYWDENSGPSRASWNYLGTIPSESFTLYGNTNGCRWCEDSPEPSSLYLFGGGVVALLAAGRRFIR